MRWSRWSRSGERSRRGMLYRRHGQAYSSLVVGFAVEECGVAWMDVEMVGVRCCGGLSLHWGPAVAAAATAAAVRHGRCRPRRRCGRHWPAPVPPPGGAVRPGMHALSPPTGVDDAGTAPSLGSALAVVITVVAAVCRSLSVPLPPWPPGSRCSSAPPSPPYHRPWWVLPIGPSSRAFLGPLPLILLAAAVTDAIVESSPSPLPGVTAVRRPSPPIQDGPRLLIAHR